MKAYPKIVVLLVALALVMALPGCKIAASTPPPTAATPTGEVNFPFTTEDSVSIIATQTALASQPQGNAQATQTPQIVVATNTPAAGNPQVSKATATKSTTDNQQGGGVAATATKAVVKATPKITRPSTYTLQHGEFPYCIARRYNLDLASFLSLNGLTSNSKPSAGTTLNIPASGTWGSQYGSRSLKSHPATITVASGDTVYSLACKYGDVAPESILAANSLSSASDLKAGMSITIP